jgi:hypothetical protein
VVIDDLTEGIVHILDSTGDTAGPGSVLTEDGLMATCAHVVESAGAGSDDTVRLVFHHTGDEATTAVEPDGWRESETCFKTQRQNTASKASHPSSPWKSTIVIWEKNKKIKI